MRKPVADEFPRRLSTPNRNVLFSRDFPAADQVGDALIFNLKRNRYRLIARVHFPAQRIYLKDLLTHAEDDRKDWLKWA